MKSSKEREQEEEEEVRADDDDNDSDMDIEKEDQVTPLMKYNKLVSFRTVNPLRSLVVVKSATSPDNENNENNERIQKQRNHYFRQMEFMDFLSAQVIVRVILIQLIPFLTIWSILAVEIASCPIFIFSKDLQELLPPLFIPNPIQLARERLTIINEVLIEPPIWKIYFLASYIVFSESRLIQFLITVISTLTSIILIFFGKSFLLSL